MYSPELNQRRRLSAPEAVMPAHVLTTYPRSGPLRKLRKSCRFCRTRKIKCDGNQPCLACHSRQKCPCIYEEQAQMGRPRKFNGNRLADRPVSVYSSRLAEWGTNVPMQDADNSLQQPTSPGTGFGNSETGMESSVVTSHTVARRDCSFDTPDVGFVELTTQLGRQQLEPFWLEVRKTMRSEYHPHHEPHSPASQSTQSSLSPNAQCMALQDPMAPNTRCVALQDPMSRINWSHDVQEQAHQQFMDDTFDRSRVMMTMLACKHVEQVSPSSNMYDHQYGYTSTPTPLSNTTNCLSTENMTTVSAPSPAVTSTLHLPPPCFSSYSLGMDSSAQQLLLHQSMSPVYTLSPSSPEQRPSTLSPLIPLASPPLPLHEFRYGSRHVSL